MINFMIHTPVNSRGRITEYVKERLPTLEAELGEKITISSPHDYETACDGSESWLINCIQKDILPDIVLTHAGEFYALGETPMSEYFTPICGDLEKQYPVRDELKMLVDTAGFFYPMSVVAIVMSYNKKNVDASKLSGSWRDMFLDRFKVVIPDNSKHITIAAGAYILKYMPEYFEQFQAFDRRFSPAEVTKSVASGEYDMSITNAGFSIMAKSRSVEINPALEGTILLPQVLAFKKGGDERLFKLAATVLEKEIQDYMGNQGFFTSNADAVMGEMVKYDGRLKEWSGWKDYINEISEYEKRI